MTDRSIATTSVGTSGAATEWYAADQTWAATGQGFQPPPALRAEEALVTYRRMMDDELIGAFLEAVSLLVGGVEWTVAPADESDEAQRWADFVQECMDDCDRPWTEIVRLSLRMLPYGFSLLEVLLKRRNGPDDTDGGRTHGSAHDDGLVGWRDFSPRPAETITKWTLDDAGHPTEAIQKAPPRYVDVPIPLSRCVYFRYGAQWSSDPWGQSLLRGCYNAWYYQTTLQRIEAVGIERDLAGIPVALMPAVVMTRSATEEQQQLRNYMQGIVLGLKKDTTSGLTLPSDRDASGSLMYDVKLMSSAGSRQIDTNPIIQRYSTRIAMRLLADFLTVGHEGSGSYALAESKTSLFVRSLKATVEYIADVFTVQAIRPLMQLNGVPQDMHPKLTPGSIDNEDLTQVASYISSLVSAGVIDPTDADLKRHVLDIAKLPVAAETDEQADEDTDQPTPDVAAVPPTLQARERRPRRASEKVIPKGADEQLPPLPPVTITDEDLDEGARWLNEQAGAEDERLADIGDADLFEEDDEE